MDREIVVDVLLLVAVTWFLYKLTVWMEPRDTPPASTKRESK